MAQIQINPEVYQAAQETAVLVDRSALGMLKISGQTRLDLIHRMSTQAVNGLPSGQGAAHDGGSGAAGGGRRGTRVLPGRRVGAGG
jgi:hypothetical protein